MAYCLIKLNLQFKGITERTIDKVVCCGSTLNSWVQGLRRATVDAGSTIIDLTNLFVVKNKQNDAFNMLKVVEYRQ